MLWLLRPARLVTPLCKRCRPHEAGTGGWAGQGAAGTGAMSLAWVLQVWCRCCKAATGGARFYKAGTGGARLYGWYEPGMGGANLVWVLHTWHGC